jgi:hypothetical protein
VSSTFNLPIVNCPHCGREFAQNHLTRHVRVCLGREDVRAAALQVLADPDKPGRAVSWKRYQERSQAFNASKPWRAQNRRAPSVEVLRITYGAQWSDVCSAFGLTFAVTYASGDNRKPHRKPPVDWQCPHCKKMFASAGAGNHHNYCAFRPDRKEMARRLAESCTAGVAVSGKEYEKRAVEANAVQKTAAPAYSTLITYFSSWEAAAHWLGLITEEEYLETQVDVQAARERAELEHEERLLAEEQDFRGLPVLRARELPGGRVAYELR